MAIVAEENYMSKLFPNAVCLLACAMLGPAGYLAAQEEPIAVAAPVAKPTSDADKPAAAATDTSASEPAKADAAKAGPATDKRVRPLTVSIQLLRSDLVLTGALTDSTMLSLRTAFGEASIPLAEVAGVRFPSGQDTTTTLVMLNGDSITGASDVKTVTVETEWGSAKINGENISSMMFVPGLEWQNTKGLNGSRWTLTEAKARPTGPTTSNPAASNSSIPGLPGAPQASGALPSNSAPNATPRVVFPR